MEQWSPIPKGDLFVLSKSRYYSEKGWKARDRSKQYRKYSAFIQAMHTYKPNQLFHLTLNLEHPWDHIGLSRGFKKLNKHFLQPNKIEFLKVVEISKRKAYHIHAILALPEPTVLDFSKVDSLPDSKNQEMVDGLFPTSLRVFSETLQERLKKYGFTRFLFEPIISLDAISKYLAKDIISGERPLAKGMQRFSYSQEIKKLADDLKEDSPDSRGIAEKIFALGLHCYKREELRSEIGTTWYFKHCSDIRAIEQSLKHEDPSLAFQYLKPLLYRLAKEPDCPGALKAIVEAKGKSLEDLYFLSSSPFISYTCKFFENTIWKKNMQARSGSEPD